MDSMDHSLPCLMDGMGSLTTLCDGEDLVVGIMQCKLGFLSTTGLQQFSLNHHHQPRTKFHLIAIIFICVALCFSPFAFSYIPIPMPPSPPLKVVAFWTCCFVYDWRFTPPNKLGSWDSTLGNMLMFHHYIRSSIEWKSGIPIYS